MNWNDVEETLESGPRQAAWLVFKWSLVLMVALFVLGSIGGTIAYTLGWFGEAATVAQEQLGARALLKKYEWFKEASAGLDKQRADIQVYEQRRKALADTYGSTPRPKWQREDRTEWNQIAAEVAGVKAAYNGLAADYNAKMAEIHWRFANVGMLPQGATEPLPREYKPYQDQ